MRIKRENKDSILFFRLGDFYEMFFEDAKKAASILNLTLTNRHGYPMAGIPYHAAQSYTARLLKAGQKIAICEQVSTPTGKGIVEREVVEILTPGTVVDEFFLDSQSNNYLVSFCRADKHLSLAYIDLSTAEFFVTSFPWEEREDKLKKELLRLSPREVLVQEVLLEEDRSVSRVMQGVKDVMINRFPEWSYDRKTSVERLKRQMGVTNLKGFGLNEDSPDLLAAGVLLEYLEDTCRSMVPHINNIARYDEGRYLGMDESTQRNLEIITNLHDGTRHYTLFEVLNYTKTSMGARNLRNWLLNPLVNRDRIDQRHQTVSRFYHDQILLSSLREQLSRILDIERLASKLAMDKAHGKDLVALKLSIRRSLALQDLLQDWAGYTWLGNFNRDKLEDVMRMIEKSLLEEPSILLTEGRLIRRGYNSELDHVKDLLENSQAVLDQYVADEKERNDIPNLKIKYNKIIGYFLEVTKANLSNVPDYFIRRQSLVNNERFTTDKLAELESELNNAQDKNMEMEKRLFLEVRDYVKSAVQELYQLAHFISRVDTLQSFAYAATVRGFVCPEMADTCELEIREGRHPVVEANLPAGDFVPNDISLEGEHSSFIMLTGPNMAGKSTYLRQVAHIVLLAQIGAFVPAEFARVGIVDKIFCRVGASDNLARGESTFLVEMNETAHILRTATESSLVIMDEVGRGTSTNDGLSIAWAVTEYLLGLGSKTLFATHYHELTHLEHDLMANYCMQVQENSGDIVFLKKVVQGAAGASYGIHAARLAGVPEEVILRANQILKTIEKQDLAHSGQSSSVQPEEFEQPCLFQPGEFVLQEIAGVDYNSLTPMDALNLVARWKKELER